MISLINPSNPSSHKAAKQTTKISNQFKINDFISNDDSYSCNGHESNRVAFPSTLLISYRSNIPDKNDKYASHHV